MHKLLALVSVLVVGCVADEESTVTRASGVDPIYLRIGGVDGETKDHNHKQWISVSFLDTTATVVYGTDCVGFSCVLASAAAHLQSGEPTLDGPASVWRYDAGPGAVVVHGDPLNDPSIEILLAGGGGFKAAMQAQLVTCAPAPNCPPIKGRICVPLCAPL